MEFLIALFEVSLEVLSGPALLIAFVLIIVLAIIFAFVDTD